MVEGKNTDWKQVGKDFGSNVLKGIGLGVGFAIAGAGAGLVASKLNKSQEGMSTSEAGARGGAARARQAA